MNFRNLLAKNLTRIIHIAPFILFGIAIFIVHKELENQQFREISHFWHHVPLKYFLIALAITIINYMILGMYDFLAMRFVNQNQIPFKRILPISFISYAISNNTGHSWASGGSIRYRFYQALGLSGWDVSKIYIFLVITYLIGLATIGFISGLALLQPVGNLFQNPHLIFVTSILCGVGLFSYLLIVLLWKKPLSLKQFQVKLPSFRTTLAQIIVGFLDMISASLVLFMFLKDIPNFDFSVFLAIYIISQIIGLVSQVPGGIGIFEGSFLWLAGPAFSPYHSEILVGLVLYRFTYYFIPLIFAGFALVAYEFYNNHKRILKVGKKMLSIFSSSIPQVLSILLLLTGIVLLASGATPAIPGRMMWLHKIIPLSLLEVSHLAGSIIGLLLLFLANGIRQKIDSAWYGSLILLVFGIFVSLIKGFDWKEASFLLVIFCILFSAKSRFYRKSYISSLSITPSWWLMIFAVICTVSWLGFFSYKHIPYSSNLWTYFSFSHSGDAARFLRSIVVLIVISLALFIRHFLAIKRPKKHQKASPEEIAAITTIVHKENDTQPFLALIGDKAIFWSEDKTAFLSYAITPKYWIVMGDPIGNKKCFENMLWQFREEADLYGAKTVFYQISEKHLPLYLDLGLLLLKLGEEALIDLSNFNLEGKKRSNLRHSHNKIIKEGYSFSIIEKDEVQQNIERIKEISDSWMNQKKVKEKAFSIGFFDESYICRTRLAVVRDSNQKIMAFANLWETNNKKELSIDLMRYDSQSARGIMDFLFAELMLWGKNQEFKSFNLGMAPLSGLERHPLAPLWHKIGTKIYDLGEEFYNFEGLYEYKAKFDPIWSSRYLATPNSLSAPVVLLTIAKLISGGFKGLVSK